MKYEVNLELHLTVCFKLNLSAKQQNSTKERDSQRKKKNTDSSRKKEYFLLFPPLTQVAQYVWNKADFDAVDPETTDYLMGKSGL